MGNSKSKGNNRNKLKGNNKSKTDCNIIYVIGENTHGELGVGKQQNSVKELTRLNNTSSSLINIFSGHLYTIISDKYHQNIWAVGDDQFGQTGVPSEADVGWKISQPWKFTPIVYFKENNIKIKEICVNPSGQTTFWITTTGDVFGNGCNEKAQLGKMYNSYYRKNTIQKIPFLKEIADIQSAHNYSIALSQTNNDQAIMIINHWSKDLLSKLIPTDIINLIIIYYKISNKVYATPYSAFGGNGHDPRKRMKYTADIEKRLDISSWKEIEILMNKNIIKVQAGYDHSLFLQDDGTLWCCGNNSVGELGLGHKKWIYQPIPIPYFVNNKIRIKDVYAGSNHHLALNYQNNVYSWGCNKFGQCGDGTISKCINTPQLIQYFKKYKVIDIDCGSFHSYCKTDNDEHYLFGSNHDNECITYNKKNKITKPFCINQTVAKYCDTEYIKGVYLGHFNTKLIVTAIKY